MSDWIWPAELEIALGGLGVGLALMSIARRRDGRPMHADAEKADRWVLVSGVLLVIVGIVRLLKP